jgi:hypothetical protein
MILVETVLSLKRKKLSFIYGHQKSFESSDKITGTLGWIGWVVLRMG